MTQPDTKRDNTRFVLTLLCMVVVTSLALFVLSRALRISDDAAKFNRDGISCVLEQLNEHRLNSYFAHQQEAKMGGYALDVPAPIPEPLPRELVAACERFLGPVP